MWRRRRTKAKEWLRNKGMKKWLRALRVQAASLKWGGGGTQDEHGYCCRGERERHLEQSMAHLTAITLLPTETFPKLPGGGQCGGGAEGAVPGSQL